MHLKWLFIHLENLNKTFIQWKSITITIWLESNFCNQISKRQTPITKF